MALSDVERQRECRARKARRANALASNVTRIVTPIVTARDEMVEILREIARAAHRANEWRDATAAASKAIEAMDQATIMARKAPQEETTQLTQLSDEQLFARLVEDPVFMAIARERLEKDCDRIRAMLPAPELAAKRGGEGNP